MSYPTGSGGGGGGVLVLQSMTQSIALATLQALGAGVKTYSVNFASALPAVYFYLFTSADHDTYRTFIKAGGPQPTITLSVGGGPWDEIFATAASIGNGTNPASPLAAGLYGVLGNNKGGGATPRLCVVSDQDLNTLTQGHIDVTAYYFAA